MKNNEKLLQGVQGAPWHGGPIREGFVAEDVFDNSTCTCNLHLSPLAEKSPPMLHGAEGKKLFQGGSKKVVFVIKYIPGEKNEV
jgi:hypothetical protein